MLQSRVKYAVSVEYQSNQRGISRWSWNEACNAISLDTARWCARNSSGKCYPLFFSVSWNRL